jgi:hypothetical protein
VNKRLVFKVVAIFTVAGLLPASDGIASNSVNFQTIQPIWITPAFSGDYSQELFIQSNQKVLLSQPTLGYPYETTSMMFEITSTGTLFPIKALGYPRNYSASIVGQIGPDLFIVDEFFNGAPADDPERTKMPNWQYPSYQKYFVKNLAGENISAGLDKYRIQRLVRFTDTRFLTTTVIKGDSPPARGEKPQYIHKFQLVNSANFSEPLQIWESQIFESERDPNWNPFIFANDSVLLGVERPTNTRCVKLISLNGLGQLDSSLSEAVNKLLRVNSKTKDLSVSNFISKPIKLSNDRLVFKMTLNSTQSLCRQTDIQAFLITDDRGGIIDLKIPNYPIFDNWKKRDVIWIECITSNRCLNIDGGGKVYWTDQNLQEVLNSAYYQLTPPDNLPISGTSFRNGASPGTLSTVNSTVKNWSATQVLINNGQIVGLMSASANMQNDPNFATQWNSNFVSSFSIPEIPKVIKTSISITCTKGKLTREVTGTNPKCPKGYKIKA